MYCSNCGNQLPEDSKFCDECGLATDGYDADVSVSNPTELQSQYQQGGVATQVRQQTENAFPLPTYDYSTPLVTKRKFAITAKQKLIIIAVGVFIILILSYFIIGSISSNPKNKVKDYFNSSISNDFSKTYDCLDIPSGDFTSKDMYIKMMDNATKNTPKKDILNYNIKEVNIKNALNGLSGLEDWLGDGANTDSIKSASTLMKYYTVEYTERGKASAQSMSIVLMKQKSKSWLFFDNFKVVSEGMVANTFDIYIPNGAKLYIDDKEVNTTYIAKNDSSGYNSYLGFDNYKITNIFTGTHNIKVIANYMKDYEKQINVYDGSSIQVSDIEITDSVFSEMSKKSEELVNLIYTSAMEGKSIDLIKSNFTTDTNQLGNIEYSYKNICEKAKKDDGTGLKEIVFADFKVNSDNKKLTSNMTYQLSANFKYNYTYTSKSFWDGSVNEYKSETPQNGNATINFIYEGNKWVVYAMNFSVYY